MVQTHSKLSTKKSTSTGFVFVIGLFILMAIMVGVFFRVGMPPADASIVLTAADSAKVQQNFIKAEQLQAADKNVEAIAVLQENINLLEELKPDDSTPLVNAYFQKCEIYRKLNQYDKAGPAIKKARSIVESSHLEDLPITCDILLREGIIAYTNQNFVEAEEYMQQALSCSESINSYLSNQTSQDLIWLANANLSPAINKPERALQYLRAVEDVCNSSETERPAQLLACQKVQAMAFMQMKKYAEAEEKLLASQKMAEKLFPDANAQQRVHIRELFLQLQREKSR